MIGVAYEKVALHRLAMDTDYGSTNHGGLHIAIYLCFNGEVEKHLCGFKSMAIRAIHSKLFSLTFAVLYYNECKKLKLKFLVVGSNLQCSNTTANSLIGLVVT